MSELSFIEKKADQIAADLANHKYKTATRIFIDLHPADQAEVFNFLDLDTQNLLLQYLDIAATADLFDELEDEDTVTAAENLSIDRLADILDEMDPDEAADLLGDLPPEQAEEALAQMVDPEDVIPLLAYPDETAGGRMTTDFIDLLGETTAQQAIDYLRDTQIDIDVPYYLFITNKNKELKGVTGLRELVIAKPETKLMDIMDPEVLAISADEDQEIAARMMTRYDLSALPVVDNLQRLVGVISHDDILDVLEDEATEDIYRLASVTDTDLEPESAIREQLKGRLPWLMLNTLTALFAAWVISNFGDLFVQVAVLAFFQSVVAGQGGNAASQSVAMIVRAIALGKVDNKRIFSILTRQMWVGLFQGLIIGIIVGVGVGLWQQNPYIGLVLGLALIGNMLVAGLVGTLTPIVLKSVGQDPAMASTVLVTAVTDSLGFLIFLSLAKLFLTYILRYM